MVNSNARLKIKCINSLQGENCKTKKEEIINDTNLVLFYAHTYTIAIHLTSERVIPSSLHVTVLYRLTSFK